MTRSRLPFTLLCMLLAGAGAAAHAQPAAAAQTQSAHSATAPLSIDNDNLLHALTGSDPRHIAWWQMTIRGLLIFAFALVLVRIARRAFERSAPVDIILGVLIGSNLSRAFTANASLVPTLVSTAVLVAVYWLIVHAAARSQRLSFMVKGQHYELVRDGEMDADTMARRGVSEDDLREAMRMSGIDDLDSIKAAYLERNGTISLLRKSS